MRTIGQLWGLETVCLRVFNAYGPGQHLPASHPPVIPYMLRQAIRSGSIVVHGSGKQTRDYVYVDDVVSAMVAASTAPGLNNLVINVGSGVETSVRELVSIVQQATGTQAEVVYNPRTDPGVSRMCADLNLAADKLNYQPRIALPEGLRLTMQRDPRMRKDATRPIKQPSM